ncbi:MAG: NAD-dependent epimerase/dehydratase family protein [Crenarchaeota archaeon]|nr:NAD-dependent epimerase/dehydratase family protein [Thermoproteota archaeon]
MRAVVTGVSGFIGSHLARALLEEGHEVVGIDLEEPSVEVDFVRADLSAEAPAELRDADAVFHLAALTDVEEAQRSPGRAYEHNVKATLKVAEAVRGRGIMLVFASSAAVYGDPLYLPIDEEHPIKPKNVYGSTKACAEMALKTMLKDEKLTILRYFNVYGPHPRMKANNVVAKFIVSALREGKVRVYGDGMQTRDFVYVDDVVRATLLALGNPGTFNVGTGRATSVSELVELLERLLGRELAVERLPPRPDDIRHSVASIKKMEKLGWRPEVGLEEGLRRTLDAYARSFIS